MDEMTALRERIVDAPMDGPSTVSELAAEFEVPVRRVDTAVSRLLKRDIVVIADRIRSHYGRTERLFDVKRTVRTQ